MLRTAWDSPSHPAEYDYLATVPWWLRKRFWEHYREIQSLPRTVSSILEVGCATGELARYLQHRYPQVRYLGFDVSQGAIDLARQKGAGEFICGHFQESQPRAELVICRDVVHHQDDPWAFLEELWHATERYLVVRLRTGPETIRRTQVLYGLEVPYWILNEEDLRHWAKPGFIWFGDHEGPLPTWLRIAIWITRRHT